MAEAPWWGGIAVLATARWIHVVHLESGMRTRPDAVPSWAWVLVATPCLWWTPEMWWWGSLLVSVAMGQALRLRMGENQPGLHFWSGMAMGAIPLVSPDMWGLFDVDCPSNETLGFREALGEVLRNSP